MKKYRTPWLCLLFLIAGPSLFSQVSTYNPRLTPAGKRIVNTAVDNIGYWKRMAVMGYAETNPFVVVEDPVYTSSRIYIPGLPTQDSPDVPVTESSTTQSENSVFIDPENEETVLNSNNSTDWTGAQVTQLYGSDALSSSDAAATWGGTFYGVASGNSGDPTTAIGNNGWWYVGKISNAWGQDVAVSTDQGQTWSDVVSGPGPGGMNLLDKNHLWIDNMQSSPYEGNLYNGWTSFIDGSPDDRQVQITRSTDQGMNWSAPTRISTGTATGNLCQGVNIHTGPNGEVYAAYIIYDMWPGDESGIGFARSLDGGETFGTAIRIIDNIKGIRNSQTNKNMRVNSFPSMTVDVSNGPNQGTIYVTWANKGVPGINTGDEVDVYLVKSADGGTTWSAPIRVNQDPAGQGKQHFLPWITCDPTTGNLCVIYYDDRNVGPAQVETWVSYSYDGGMSWTDFKVSDVAFTPAPIAGLAANYFGDYLGISARNMMVYPTWTDNRSGRAMTYVSPFFLGPAPNQPYVIYYSNELTSIPGKSRQEMNYGDSLYLSLGLKNIGDQPAENLVVTLSTASPYIRITDITENYGTMAAGEIKVVPEGYAFDVSDTIPDGTKVRFEIHAASPDTSWNSHFTLEAHAPSLRILSFTIDDTAGGNGNRKLDPGESANIIIINKNTGDFACQNTVATLTTTSSAIQITAQQAELGTLEPGQSSEAVFPVTVGEEIPTGTGVSLEYLVTSGNYHAHANYQEMIGAVVEDWETHTFIKFPWTFSGFKPWLLTAQEPFEGQYSAMSGDITDNQSSGIFLTYTSSVDDSISFYRKVSSESGWDYLKFLVDGLNVDQWSGEADWQRFSYPVTAGTHTYQWVYAKDIFAAGGQDKGWVDYIEFPPPVIPVIDAGPDDTICEGGTYMLAASAELFDSLLWKTSGDGTFDTPNIVAPTYIPGPGDIQAGSVRLTMTAWAKYGLSINGMNLTIASYPVAAITVDPKDTVCAWQTITLEADTSQDASYLWMPGAFTGRDLVVDTALAGGLGTSQWTVTVTNPYGCASRDSARITFRDCTAIQENSREPGLSVSPNPAVGSTWMVLVTPAPEKVNISLKTAGGTEVLREEGVNVPGFYARSLDLTKYAAGIYILTVEREGEDYTVKIVLKK